MKTSLYTSPLQFAAALTADFVRLWTGAPGRSLLDVGCGDGLVALELSQVGFQIVAIDGHQESIEKSCTLGLDARHCLLRDFDQGPFDVILLSRSLHHMPPLVETVDKLADLTGQSSIVVVEDFGFELIDNQAAAWLIAQTRAIKTRYPDNQKRHKWLCNADNLSPEEARQLWLDHHWKKHQLLDSSQMKEAVARRFVIDSGETCAYLFRYLCDLLPATVGGAKAAEKIYREEVQLIKAGKLPAVGLRMVLKRKVP